MPQWLEMLILSIVQGIAEFLPISSSGHLVLLQTAFRKMEETILINVVLHAGTLLSILCIYHQQIIDILTKHRRLIGMLIIGTLPAATVGLTIKTLFPNVLESPWISASMLIVTGIGLLWIRKQPEGPTDYAHITWKQAFAIGCFQAVGILPGISRSGSTIFAGLLVGLNRNSAATFSFLLAIPAILGATVLELKDLGEAPPDGMPRLYLLAGAGVSFFVGLFALVWLKRWLNQGKLHYFAFWCIPFGLISLVALVIRSLLNQHP